MGTNDLSMTETITRVGFSREAFDAFLQSRGEPDWLRELREKAWTERFARDP